MAIEKFVSPFIPQQFPAFYKEEGPNFIAFLKAYYEWMENSQQTLQYARALLENSDIDTTEAEFIKYFKNTYLHSLPESIIADKRLLVKHILDLYRAKGTPRAYELLFRMLFNEDIEIYIPANFLFKPSDAEWDIPKYIEVSDSPYLELLIGQQIYNSSRNSTAVVETVNKKIVGNRLIHTIYLSSVNGRFKYNEKILCSAVPQITLDNAPIILGSLTAVAIENGGSGFSAGDILDVSGTGVSGKARVAAVRNENGKVQFNLINGGSGFSMNAVVTVATALYLNIANNIGTFSENETIVSSNTSANGTITFANTSLIQMINFSTGLNFYVGDNVTGSNGATATVVSVIGGGGTGATFQVGGLINKEILYVNTDKITNYINANLSLTWSFPKNPVANLTSVIADTLSFVTVEAGTIAYLSNINPGTGYSANPYVDVIESDVAGEGLPDGLGGTKGHNADITTNVSEAQGVVVAAEVINSGYGFTPGDTVFLSTPGNEGVIVTASAVIELDGVGDGYWKDNKSFLSDVMKIQDSYYYQDFSYDIVVKRMLNVYEKTVKDLIHPSGIALFGRFRIKNELISNQSEPESFSLTQT